MQQKPSNKDKPEQGIDVGAHRERNVWQAYIGTYDFPEPSRKHNYEIDARSASCLTSITRSRVARKHGVSADADFR